MEVKIDHSSTKHEHLVKIDPVGLHYKFRREALICIIFKRLFADATYRPRPSATGIEL